MIAYRPIYKRTTIMIDRKLWGRFRIFSIKQGRSSSRILEELIRKELHDKSKKQDAQNDIQRG